MIKKSLLFGIMVLSFLSVDAQVQTPQASSKAKVEQIVGLTNITIEYSRPNLRGRSVFGDLVPYGRLWRTGANMNTVVTFGDDVIIDGKTLKKGKYALYTVPKVESWEVIFYSDPNNWGLPEYFDETKIALSTLVKPIELNRKLETFTIALSNINFDYADLEIQWEKTVVPIRVQVPTERIALQSIDETLAGPKAVDYYAASQYYFVMNKDLQKALQWIDEAIVLKESKVPYHFYRLKSQIQAKLGDKKGAVETAKISLKIAEKEDNTDYIKTSKDSILEWSK